MNKPQVLMMNVWVADFDPWNRNFDPSTMPYVTEYDYVEVQSYDAATDGFTFLWRDNFDYFDYSKWIKSNDWTFGGNLVTFSWDNVFTMNGSLNLRIDRYP